MTVKHQGPSARWDELQGNAYLGIGGDPGIREFALAAVAVKNVPKGKALQRVHDLNRHWSIVGLHVVREADAYTGERSVVTMANTVPGALRQFLLSSAAQVGGSVLAEHVLAVEGQHVSAGTTPDPTRILDLANVAGAALGTDFGPARWIKLRPVPNLWKGEQPKLQNQSNTWRKFGIKTESSGGKEPYAVPLGMGKHPFKKTDWKNLGDALGLAVFAIETTWPF